MQAFTGPQETLVVEDPLLPEVGVSIDLLEKTYGASDDRYLVRLDPPMDRSAGGVLVPEKSIPMSRSGVVVSCGPGALSDDGRTRMPQHAKPGQRILFEYAAGYSIPRVPDVTKIIGRRTVYGYKVIKDGSIIAVVDGTGAWPAFVQPPEDVIPRLRLIQDWLLVKNDRPQMQVELPGKQRKRRRPEVAASIQAQLKGRAILLPSGAEQIQLAQTWTGRVVARGPGLLTVTRCLDGDRMGLDKPRCAVGDRIHYTTEFPLLSLPGVNGYALVREVLCLAGVLGA